LDAGGIEKAFGDDDGIADRGGLKSAVSRVRQRIGLGRVMLL
jgi:hypothetical protein